MVGKAEAISATHASPHILLNRAWSANKLGYEGLSGLDILELFAYIHPARFMVPTLRGLADVLALAHPVHDAQAPQFLLEATERLLATLGRDDWAEREGAWLSVQGLMKHRWPWAQLILPRLPKPRLDERWLFSKLPEWEESPPRPLPRPIMLDKGDILTKLAQIVGAKGEARQGQKDYALAAAQCFAPRAKQDVPHLVLAQAGTGIGKTLGYLTPVAMWSKAAEAGVWISTFTKALQRQLHEESLRFTPHSAPQPSAGLNIVVRKGRENYLCLLNLEDALQNSGSQRNAIFAQLVARWAAYSRDGDMVGGDMPGWLPTLFRGAGATRLSDRRGECIYTACAHYRKCFIERSVQESQNADIVIANHALLMVNAARGRGTLATRLVFDEGHHLFEAADSMFSLDLSGMEAIEFRRWIIGTENDARGRRRGLAARLSDIAQNDEILTKAINSAIKAAETLPQMGWHDRIINGEPQGEIEALLAAVRSIILARAPQEDYGYALETHAQALPEAFQGFVSDARDSITALMRPLSSVLRRCEHLLQDAPDWLEASLRVRLENAHLSLGWRCDILKAWVNLLQDLGNPAQELGESDYIDWLSLDRIEGRERNIGINRHWLNPMVPFAQTVLEPAHGVLITSATLKGQEEWRDAEARTGFDLIKAPIAHFEARSPFDYAKQSEVLLVHDVPRNNLIALAHAYKRLIEASGGGALGLFTAIRRLREVHHRIIDPLHALHLPLYAQHVDPMDTGTLVDIFRAEARASLLGTDALRDGVDVPGHSLRLVIMENVPWSRPTVLHQARKAAFGNAAYEDMLVRARLAQAFGRLIRREHDHGSFVLLSSSMPSRLLNAFPTGTPVKRLSLEEAVACVEKVTRERKG